MPSNAHKLCQMGEISRWYTKAKAEEDLAVKGEYLGRLYINSQHNN